MRARYYMMEASCTFAFFFVNFIIHILHMNTMCIFIRKDDAERDLI